MEELTRLLVDEERVAATNASASAADTVTTRSPPKTIGCPGASRSSSAGNAGSGPEAPPAVEGCGP